MNKDNAITRRKLKQIGTIKEFEDIINCALLSEEEKIILKMHYGEQKPLTYIADVLALSESAIKKKHSKLLMKVGRIVGNAD